ncbi:MAG: alpha/beta hydrolase [Lachnospiraceae bacterium]|nr:alpha/beta hydrolase [Lachnospiraceae bacterium]
MKELVIYVHGKGGNISEADHFKKFFPDADMYGFDYKSENPWDAKKEFAAMIEEKYKSYEKITLVAQSIGAYFSMCAGPDRYINRAFFISPIVSMEALIMDMIRWAGTDEATLKEKGIIPVDFGDDLSWEYLQYVRSNPIIWNTPTEILYGSLDNLQSRDTIDDFVQAQGAGLTVMEGGEHWFHTDEQMEFLDRWIVSVL